MKTFAKIIKDIKKITGAEKDYEVAQLLNLDQKTFSSRKNRESIPLENLRLFCEKRHLSLNALLEKDYDDKEMFSDLSEEEFLSIPQVSGKISSGGGLVPNNVTEMRIAFRQDWIQRKGSPKNMVLIKVKGDSMEPTLRSGDLVLIDQNLNYVDPHGGIYAIVIEDEIMLKRLQILFPEKKIKIISDNPIYEPREVDPEFLVINGKMIWFCREVER